MAAGYLHDQPVVRAEFKFIAAEHARLGYAIEAGVDERVVDLLRIGAPLIRFVLLRAQHGPHRDGAFEQPIGCHIRFGLRDQDGAGRQRGHAFSSDRWMKPIMPSGGRVKRRYSLA